MKKLKTIKIVQKSIKIFAFMSFAFMFLQSCNKDEYQVIDNGEAIPTSQALSNLFDGKITSLTNVEIFDASTTLNYTSPKGVTVNITGSCLRKNGNPVTGPVKFIYREIFDKGNMLTSNQPTMGNTAGEKRLMVSGGEFYLQAEQDGVKLTLTCPMIMQIPTSLTGGPDSTMQPYKGIIGADGELSWDLAPTYDLYVQTNGSVSYYNAVFQEFGSFNCDRFYNYTGPRTGISILVPQGYGTGNSTVFIATKTIPNSLGKTYGQFPIGLDCYIIFVTEKNGQFRYAVKPQVLTANHQVTFNLSDLSIATANQLTAAINALP